ncbi:MAG: hypothetical protein ACKO6N_00170, partial [Myxococcota bacterium]
MLLKDMADECAVKVKYMLLEEHLTPEHLHDAEKARLEPSVWPRKASPEEGRVETLIHKLGKQLWEDKNRVHHDHRLLLVADPLACMVTLVWRACEDTVKEDFLERSVHAYFRHLRQTDRMLAQRAGLQLVLMPDPALSQGGSPKLKRDFSDHVQQILRRIGEACLDLQFRWVEEPPEPPEIALGKLLETLFSAHGQLTLNARGGGGHTSYETSLRADVKAFKEGLEPLLGDSGGRDSSAAPEVDFPVVTAVLKLDLLSIGLKRELVRLKPKPEEIRSSSEDHGSPSLLLGLNIMARRFVSCPLHFGLGPITLLASENASGKTTLAEAVSQLYHGLPRPRVVFPERATQFGDSTQKGSTKWKLTAHRLTHTDNIVLPKSHFLALFADDADLSRGQLGPLSTLSLLPVLSVEDCTALIEMSRTCREGVERIQGYLEWLKNVQPREVKSEETAEIWKSYKDALPGLSMLAEDSTQWSWKELQDNELESLLRHMKATESAQVYVEKLTKLGKHLYASPNALHSHLSEALSLKSWEIERALDRYVNALEEKLLKSERATLGQLENHIYHFLDVGLELPRGERPNTARQVRRAFAARLARWLLATNGELPILLVDEPVLGQDASAAAAAIGR